MHVGIIGTGKHQFSICINYLCVPSNIRFYLVRGAAVDDSTIPYRHGLTVRKQPVHGADSSVQDN